MDAERARVLVVDDERFFREAIREVLEARGERCLFAATGAEAIERAAEPEVGVVVLDVNLPDRSGLEVFRALQASRPELRVVVLSAHTDQETVLEALRLGAFDYLAKPLHDEELALAVRRARETFGIAAGWTRMRARLRTLESAVGSLGEAARGAAGAEGGAQGEAPDAARRDAVARAAVEAAAGLLRAERASLLLRAPEGGLRLAAAHGFDAKAPGGAREDPEGEPIGAALASGVLERGEALLAEDVHARRGGSAAPDPGRYRTGACALAPVPAAGAGGSAQGVLCAADPSEGAAFGEEELALLRILAGQVAPLLAPAAPAAGGEAAAPAPAAGPALEAGPAAPLEAELARAVCDATAGYVEPERVLAEALRPVGELLGAAPVSLHLLDPEGRLVREAEWDGGRRSDRAALAPGRGLTGVALGGGGLVATDAPGADPRFDPEVDTPEDGRSGPLLCGALRFRGRVLGCFRAFPEKPDAAAPALGEALASALSAAVRSVLLYRSLVDATEELARARREGPGA